MAALSLRASDELSHLGHRAASKDLVEVGPQSALHKVSEDTDPCDLPWNSGTIKTSSAANTSPPMTLAQMAALHLMGCSLTVGSSWEISMLATTTSCGESPAPLNHVVPKSQNTILAILNKPRAYPPSGPDPSPCRAGPTTAPGGSRRASGQRCGGDPAFDTARWAYRTWHRQSRQCSLSSTS